MVRKHVKNRLEERLMEAELTIDKIVYDLINSTCTRRF